MAQASPELMKYFRRWFRYSVGGAPDPYDLKGYADTLYGLAFGAVALGACCLEWHE